MFVRVSNTKHSTWKCVPSQCCGTVQCCLGGKGRGTFANRPSWRAPTEAWNKPRLLPAAEFLSCPQCHCSQFLGQNNVRTPFPTVHFPAPVVPNCHPAIDKHLKRIQICAIAKMQANCYVWIQWQIQEQEV